MTHFVIRYNQRDETGRLTGSEHRRINARTLSAATKVARANLPAGHELGPISEATARDKQPWVGENPYADRQREQYVRGER